MRDNQGRNLDAVKRHFDMLARQRLEGEAMSARLYQEKIAQFPLADWTTFEGVLVLRAGSSRFVGAPRTEKKNSRTFDVIDIADRTLVTQLTSKEIRSWLWQASQNEDEIARMEH